MDRAAKLFFILMTPLAAKSYASEPVKLVSSIMWQCTEDQESCHDGSNSTASRFIYPAGLPAVLKRGENLRTYTVEQHYKPKLKGDIRADITGPWLAESNFKYVSASNVKCRHTESDTICMLRFTVAPKAPSGTISIAMRVKSDQQYYGHQNSLFRVVIPEHRGRSVRRPTVLRDNSAAASNLNSVVVSHAEKLTVQISMEGSVTLGSGFFVRNPDTLFNLFFDETKKSFENLSHENTYILTASHLFPMISRSRPKGMIPQGIQGSSYFDDGEYLTLQVMGRVIPRAARLVIQNMEADLALLALTADAKAIIISEGLMTLEELSGLEIADHFAQENSLITIGYPESLRGKVQARVGVLGDKAWPTDDTSNFGPLRKFKLDPINSVVGLAEFGYSGGPVINSEGQVVGLAIERPTDSLSLIAVDLTHLRELQAKDWLDRDGRCHLSFSPFDRTLVFGKLTPACSYGAFGGTGRFEGLSGKWKIQEVLGFDDEAPRKNENSQQTLRGHDPIGGHVNIGHAIIGHAIINGSAIVAGTSYDLTKLGDFSRSPSIQFHPDAFRPLAPRGVRILQAGADMPLGELIVGTKKQAFDPFYCGIYSIRDFALWLHQTKGPIAELVCRAKDECAEEELRSCF